MIINKTQPYNLSNRNCGISFKSSNESLANNVSYGADKFIQDVEKSVAVQKSGNFLSKYVWSTTALIPAGLLVLPYEFYSLRKIKKLKKAGLSQEFNAAKKSFKKIFPWLAIGSVVMFAGLQYIFGRNFDKRYEDLKKNFDKINTSTDAKLVDYTMTSTVMGALCSPISGNVVINKNILRDPISRRRVIKLIKHELVHAKQYETIARSDNGIKKLNYAVMKSSAKSVDTIQGRAELEQVYNDIINDKTGKYDNKILEIVGAEVNMKDYVVALHTLLVKKDCSLDDIPMVINAEHYENVRARKGKLTEEEELKAEKYYKAQIDYPLASPIKMLNPFSDYYNNLLEKEAYKESPNLMTFIRKICGKQ